MTGFWLIFLTVLKVIGFVLLGILAFVLFIILLVCLVPVRYGGHVKYEEKANGYFRVTWLLHAVSAGVVLKDNKPELRIRLLGFIKIGEKKKEESPDGADAEAQFASAEESVSAADEIPEETGERPPEGGNAADADLDDLSEVYDEDTLGQFEAGEETGSGETAAEKDPEEKNGGKEQKEEQRVRPGFVEFYREMLEKLENLLSEKYEAVLQKIREKIPELKKKYADIKDKAEFFTQPRVLAAVKHILKLVLKLLKSFLPRRISGKAALGLDSPADTGKYYGMICALYPIHKNRIEVTPVFDHKEIKADVKMRGRIVIGYIVVIAVRMILNRNVIYTLRNIKKHI